MTGIEAPASPPPLPRWFGPRASAADPAVAALIAGVARGAGWGLLPAAFHEHLAPRIASMLVALPIRLKLRVGDDILSMRARQSRCRGVNIELTVTTVSDRTRMLW